MATGPRCRILESLQAHTKIYQQLVILDVSGAVNIAGLAGLLSSIKRILALPPPPSGKRQILLDLTGAEIQKDALAKFRGFLQARRSTLPMLRVVSDKIESADARTLDLALASLRLPEAEEIRELVRLDSLYPRLVLEGQRIEQQIRSTPDFSTEWEKLRLDLADMAAQQAIVADQLAFLSGETVPEARWEGDRRKDWLRARAEVLGQSRGPKE